MTTAAQIIAERLAHAGCRFAFGIPGGEVLSILDALGAAGIRFVLAKHENAAGFMAEGAWHQTGAPGILVATIGPGVANAVNVIANAHQDRVPLIVLTGCVDPAEAYTYTHQVFDHGALLAPITKATMTAAPGAVATVVDRALMLAREGRPGPVHIDLPIGLADAAEPAPPQRPRPVPAPAGPAPGPALATARHWLEQARRPLIIAGLDVVTQGAEAAVAGFAARHGMPVITTYKAKGVIDEAAPLALGAAGLSPKADALLLPLVAAADLVILAGYDPIEMRIGWRAPFGADQRVVDLAAVANTHDMHRESIGFVGDIAAGLAALDDGVALLADPWPDGEPAAVRAALGAAFAPEAEGWGPATAFAIARRVLPAETVVTADSGAHRILLSQIWTCPAPRRLLQSSALCTMGCALPLALGSALADPSPAPAPRLVVVGDAGLEMVLGELATARDLALPVIVLVMVDESLALIEMKQRARQMPNLGVDFAPTDFATVARALGGEGITVADADGLEEALTTAMARRDRFTVIACVIGRRAYEGKF